MLYDFNREKRFKNIKIKVLAGVVLLLIIIAAVIASGIYLEILQLDEIGNLSGIYLTNLTYKVLFSLMCFIFMFAVISMTNILIKRNLKKYFKENNIPQKKLLNYVLSAVTALVGSFLTWNFFYQKALNFLNYTPFGKNDPIFSQDIGYYVFQRPFLMSIYDFFAGLWIFVIIYTISYYLVVLFSVYNNISLQDLKIRSVLRHNLVNIALFFVIKAFSYRFQKEGILYSTFVNVNGAGYVDVHIWLNYFKLVPFLLLLIVAAAFVFIWKNRLKTAAIAVAVFPAVWIIVSIVAATVQALVVKPNEINLESNYLTYNMQKTREAYNLEKVKYFEFPEMQNLTPDILSRNIDTKNNIRIVDYQATLDSDIQLQSNTNFYSFHNGDIINYTVNNKDIPIFITAREIDKNKLPEKSYINTMFKYTHGYGVVINPLNQLTAEGQVGYILSDLRMNSVDRNLKISEPRIYYGELTRDHVIVNAANKLNEIDYDGNKETNYSGKGGIRMSFLNRILFALKYGDFNMIISGYVSSDSKLLLNREIISRAQKAVPFLTVDNDPYILLTADGRLKWVLDAYATTRYYPYSQLYGDVNYIRNSVKIVIDAYDGKVKYYVIDKNDPLIKTYMKIYPGVFSDEPMPADVTRHMRYPELLFKIQTDILKRYHLEPSISKNSAVFYSNQDLWDIAKYPDHSDNVGMGNVDSGNIRDIDPYYNMIKLPGNIGKSEELILMRPFTPSNKHNMISWLAVRNNSANYGELILFGFPKNTNIFGPYQVEVKINQIDKVSKDITLWGQSGSRVFKGSLLVIPIENSVLYVEPIYIQSSGPSSIPEVREIIVGYQKGDEFRFGIGTNLDDALNQLFTGILPSPAGTAPAVPAQQTGKAADQKLINDIMSKYDTLKKQLDELGNLINELKK